MNCPNCQCRVPQAKNKDGPNFCPVCLKLFYVEQVRRMPPWILGVVVFLVAHLQIISR